MCAPTKLNFLFCKRVPEKNTGVCICNNLFTPLEKKSSKHSFTWIEIREMVNFELPSCHGRRTKKKKFESPWGIEPQTFGFSAPMLYHWATEALLRSSYDTRHMHTVRISNVVMFVDRNKHLWNSYCYIRRFCPDVSVQTFPRNNQCFRLVHVKS